MKYVGLPGVQLQRFEFLLDLLRHLEVPYCQSRSLLGSKYDKPSKTMIMILSECQGDACATMEYRTTVVNQQVPGTGSEWEGSRIVREKS